jgi:hypothetical protein
METQAGCFIRWEEFHIPFQKTLVQTNVNVNKLGNLFKYIIFNISASANNWLARH